MASPLLDKATLDALTNKTTVKSTILASSVARLYVSTDRQWKYTGIYGIIAYIMDRESRVQYIRIYDLSTMSIRFQTEIAVDSGYYMDTEYFHTLEMESDAIVGFLFSIAREKSLPEDKNKTLTSEAKRFGSKVMQLSLKESDLKEVKDSKGATPQFDAANGKRRASTIMGAMRTVHKAASKFLGGTQAPASVGAPTDFRHVGHIGLNPDGTMSVNNVPDEWKVFLKAAGITKKDFMNPEKNKVIVSTLGAMLPPSSSNSSGSSGSTPSSSKDQKTPKQVQVKYKYERAGEKEVSVTAGDMVTLVKSYQDGWAKIKKNNGEVGMVPVEYLRESSSSELSQSPLQQPSQAIPKRDSPKNSPAVNSVPKKAAPPPVPASPAKSTSAPPPARSVPPRPVSSRPPPAPSAAKGPVPAPQEEAAPAEEYSEEPAEDEAAAAPAAKPDMPRPNAMLLAGIQSFDKTDLAKAEDDEDRPARPPLNPLLASIQGFNKDGLSRAESTSSLPSKPSTPNPLEAIKSGNFQLKKVDKVEKPVEAKAPVPAEVEGIAGLLKAKLANIRLGVQDDDDDDDAGSDWD